MNCVFNNFNYFNNRILLPNCNILDYHDHGQYYYDQMKSYCHLSEHSKLVIGVLMFVFAECSNPSTIYHMHW